MYRQMQPANVKSAAKSMGWIPPETFVTSFANVVLSLAVGFKHRFILALVTQVLDCCRPL